MRRKRDEDGVALLTVLLLVAVMSAIAVSVLDDIRFAIRRTRNVETGAQAQWYALGAESLARAKVGQLIARTPGRTTLEGDWSGKPLVFPVEHGVLSARLADRGACFNLNSVVIGTADEAIPDSAGIAQLAGLIETAGVDRGEAIRLAASVADWIDANEATNLYGAEDDAYARRSPSYRTGGAWMAEETELRAVAGFTPEIYARVRPYVCALPEDGPTRINVNTLLPEQAPVLSALYEGRLPLAAARQAIEARPAKGWTDVQSFLAQPTLVRAAKEAGEPRPDQLALSSRYFSLDAQVEFAQAQVVLSALLEADATGKVRTVARRWTPAE